MMKKINVAAIPKHHGKLEANFQMQSIKFEALWVARSDIPREKIQQFSNMQLHNRNYTEFVELPPLKKAEMNEG